MEDRIRNLEQVIIGNNEQIREKDKIIDELILENKALKKYEEWYWEHRAEMDSGI